MSGQKPVWAWSWWQDSDVWFGPFATREAAESECLAEMESDEGGVVAPARYPRAADYVGTLDLDELLERMDEAARDAGCYSEDALFVVDEGERAAAVAMLDEALRAWAGRWVRATAFTVDSDQALPVRR